MIWHGWTYQTGPAAQWPGDHAWGPGGATGFNVGDAYGPRVPGWADHRKVNDNLARIQLAMRQGKPDLDVAVYYHDYGMKGTSNGVSTTQAQFAGDSALSRSGYLYEYLSPEYLRRKDARFRHGSLFPDQSDYQAMVFNNQTALPVDVARKLLDLARSGMPMVFIGALPNSTPGGRDPGTQDAEVTTLAKQMAALPSVKRVDTEAALPAALDALCVHPTVQRPQDSAAIQVMVRRTPKTDYYFLWNRTDAPVTQDLTLRGSGQPFHLDTWKGTIERATRFESTPRGVRLPITLAADDAALIALSRTNLDERPAPAQVVTNSTADSVVYLDSTHPAARSAEGGTVTTKLDSGRTISTTLPAAEKTRMLNTWTLDVDSYEPGPAGKPLPQTPRNPVFTTVHKPLGPFPLTADANGTLPSWATIPGLADKAGIGTYKTSFTLERGWAEGQGAYLNLGNAVDSVSVTVNGHALPPVDQSSKKAIDLGKYLVRGENTLQVRVATPMFNAVGTARIEQGLFGPVTLAPYSQVNLKR